MTGIAGKTCFLFDLDGTLVDSNPLHERVFREVLQRHGMAPRFDYEPLKGKTTVAAFQALGPFPAEVLSALVREKQSGYRSAVQAGGLRLTAGAWSTLQFLRGAEKRLFVVSGGSRSSVDAALESTGIHEFFEGVVTGDDVTHAKPAPESFLLCLERFEIPVAQAVGVEDSASGLASCQAAGLDVVLVNNAELTRSFRPSFPSLAEFREALIGDEAAADAS